MQIPRDADRQGGQADAGARRPATRVAVLTPGGRGALAVVGICGPQALAAVDAVFRPRGGGPVQRRADGSICFGRWLGQATAAGEDVVVVRHAADTCEIHCHGGLAASAAVVGSLVAAGATAVSWETWLSNCGGGTAAAPAAIEAGIAIARAAGPQAARILARQIAGALDREIGRIRGLRAVGDDQAARAACDRLLRAGRIGRRLTTPWRVVVLGPVNAGKSSLVNALAGHARSLVSPLPGTTRDLVVTRVVLGGWDVELIDTAGLRVDEPDSDVERTGIDRARAAEAAADLVLRVTAADDVAPRQTAPTAAGDLERPPLPAPPVIDVISKADLGVDRTRLASDPAAVLTSVRSGEGIELLATRIGAAIIPELTLDPDLLAGAVPFTPAQLALIAELLPGASNR